MSIDTLPGRLRHHVGWDFQQCAKVAADTAHHLPSNALWSPSEAELADALYAIAGPARPPVADTLCPYGDTEGAML